MRQQAQEKSFYFFLGTTAELIKIAPILKEFKKRNVAFRIIASGQRDLLFEDLKEFTGPLKPDITLVDRGRNPSMFSFMLWAIKTFVTGLLRLQYEFKGLNKKRVYFIIHGDTVSSTIGAIIAKIYRLKLVHVESGYLSHDLLEPFPEEICRSINISLADILFAPTDWSRDKLKGKNGTVVNTKQNTMIETFWWALKSKTGLVNYQKYKKYYVLILHRQEHMVFRKNWSKKILKFIIKNAENDLNCLLLNHPLTLKIIQSLNLGKNEKKKVTLLPLMPYAKFVKLLSKSQFIASDGCTNQQETYYMGKPLLALRDRQDQAEGIGRNVVICRSSEEIMKDFLKNYKKYKFKPVYPKINPSKIVADYLLK